MVNLYRSVSSRLCDDHGDDDFDVIAGKRDQLLGRIQERHGISRDEAEKQVKDWESRDGRTPDALWFERY
jgi:hypothetical protein